MALISYSGVLFVLRKTGVQEYVFFIGLILLILGS